MLVILLTRFPVLLEPLALLFLEVVVIGASECVTSFPDNSEVIEASSVLSSPLLDFALASVSDLTPCRLSMEDVRCGNGKPASPSPRALVSVSIELA